MIIITPEIIWCSCRDALTKEEAEFCCLINHLGKSSSQRELDACGISDAFIHISNKHPAMQWKNRGVYIQPDERDVSYFEASADVVSKMLMKQITAG